MPGIRMCSKEHAAVELFPVRRDALTGTSGNARSQPQISCSTPTFLQATTPRRQHGIHVVHPAVVQSGLREGGDPRRWWQQSTGAVERGLRPATPDLITQNSVSQREAFPGDPALGCGLTSTRERRSKTITARSELVWAGQSSPGFPVRLHEHQRC